MSTLAPANAPVAGNAPGAEDLGPLAWVLGEIQKSLETASKSLRRFAREIMPVFVREPTARAAE